ncbi:MAG: DUF4258 domain-containing protein [Candidatus Eisenbacteria bacterium]|nr:DUF4258 domain-containing protein [Candidatus Eisenbacteria bacterium]
MKEPLKPADAERLIARILEEGAVRYSRHAFQEMANDELATLDIENILRAGVVEPAEFENGSWRYRVRTPRMMAVVAFRSESQLVVVTAWREKK